MTKLLQRLRYYDENNDGKITAAEFVIGAMNKIMGRATTATTATTALQEYWDYISSADESKRKRATDAFAGLAGNLQLEVAAVVTELNGELANRAETDLRRQKLYISQVGERVETLLGQADARIRQEEAERQAICNKSESEKAEIEARREEVGRRIDNVGEEDICKRSPEQNRASAAKRRGTAVRQATAVEEPTPPALSPLQQEIREAQLAIRRYYSTDDDPNPKIAKPNEQDVRSGIDALRKSPPPRTR